ncbi:MAG: transglutaminase family protein [Candidatus Heimdallarchaeota archaeon]
MSSDDVFGRDPAPSSIRYLILLSAFTSLLTAVSFIPSMVGTNSQETNFFQTAIPGFLFFSVISIPEWFFLRRSRKMLGPYGLAFAVEIVRSIALQIAGFYYVQQVETASSTAFSLLQVTSLLTLALLVGTKVARSRLEELAERDVTRNILNLLPTILVLLLFLGTYLTEIAGLNTPRQQNLFPDYTDKEIDWSMFNTPTWDATYLLENLLDQFTAGLSAPDTILFNVTSDQADPQGPTTYWRLGTLEAYEYTNKPPYSTDWNPTQKVKRILSTGAPSSSAYSQLVDPADRTAKFTVLLPLDHNSSLGDVTVNPNYQNYLPTTWNGQKGSYIDSNSFRFFDSIGNSLSATTKNAREVFPLSHSDDLLGVDANLLLDTTSNETGLFTYDIDYEKVDVQSAAAFSLTRSENDYLQALGSDAATWSAIKTLYLQLPNETGTLPTQMTNLPYISSASQRYQDWAPKVYENATNLNDSGLSVFGQAYKNMLSFENFTFDVNMWLGRQIGFAPGVANAHPAQYEDFNEWFFRRPHDGTEGGVSIHFAGSYAIINRLQGIPTRMVIGYLGGNDSIDYYPYRAVSARFLHAWAEVLIPMLDPINGYRAEWVSFDPLLSYLASQYGLTPPTDIVPTSSVGQSITIRSDYDLENQGLFQAGLDHQDMKTNGSGDFIFGRVITNYTASNSLATPYTLANGVGVNVSVRLIATPSAVMWIPLQGANFSFYAGISGENSSGIWLGNSSTDSRGVATLLFTVDITQLGIRTIYFYVEVNLGASGGVRKAAISWPYVTSFF